jgi:hypothetical protein
LVEKTFVNNFGKIVIILIKYCIILIEFWWQKIQ